MGINLDNVVPRRRRRLIRIVVPLLLALSASLATTVPLLACDIGIQPSSASGVAGDTVTFAVTMNQTHRSCLVPIDETQFSVSGVSIVSQTPWTQTSSMSFETQLTVTLDAPGEGRVEVVRVCAKGGDRVAAVVSILPREAVTPSASGGVVEEEQATEDDAQGLVVAEQEPVTGEPTGGPADPANPAAIITVPSSAATAAATAPTWQQSLWETLTLPYIIVLLSLMVTGTFFLARGNRKARPFAMLIALGFLGFYVGGCPCAIGGMLNVFAHFGDVAGYMTAYVQFGAVVLVTLLFGRVFCGWACPMGATQFFLFRKEQGKKNRWREIPREQDRILRLMKYLVLVILVVLSVLAGRPVFEDIDPFRALFNLDFRWGVPLAFLIVLVGVSLVIGFPFCKYLCPLGAFLSLIQPLSLFKLRFSSSCTNCKACSNVACDYGAIEPGGSGPTINQRECVRCGECLSRCPCNAIVFTARGK
jgi:NosR/NirI family transcriptional regulator, nitrous oxide reductase regulator